MTSRVCRRIHSSSAGRSVTDWVSTDAVIGDSLMRTGRDGVCLGLGGLFEDRRNCPRPQQNRTEWPKRTMSEALLGETASRSPQRALAAVQLAVAGAVDPHDVSALVVVTSEDAASMAHDAPI